MTVHQTRVLIFVLLVLTFQVINQAVIDVLMVLTMHIRDLVHVHNVVLIHIHLLIRLLAVRLVLLVVFLMLLLDLVNIVIQVMSLTMAYALFAARVSTVYRDQPHAVHVQPVLTHSRHLANAPLVLRVNTVLVADRRLVRLVSLVHIL